MAMGRGTTLQPQCCFLLLAARVILATAAQDSITDAPFDFSANFGGWQVHAQRTELSLTWLASGATWSSSLVNVDFVHRYSVLNNGCWDHEVKRSFWDSQPSTATLNGGEMLPDGSVMLEGTIVAPARNANATAPINWTINLLAESTGAIFFNIEVDLAQPVLAARRLSGVTGNKDLYRFGAADVSLKWRLAESVEDEQIVGAGEQYSMMGLRGEAFYIWSGEQGIGRGLEPISASMKLVAYPCGGDSHTTYSAVPAFLSTRGYGLAFDNSQLMKVDLTSPSLAKITVTFEDASLTVSSGVFKPKISGRIWGGGKDVRSLLPGLTAITGRMSAPPQWTQEGLVIGDEGGYKVVQSHVDTLLAAKVPVAGVWIQDWSGKISSSNGQFVWWNWVLDEERYPKDWFRNMSARGIKVLTYVNPFLTNQKGDSGNPAVVFDEAKRLGHLIVDAKGAPIVKKVVFADFHFGMVDVFKPEAREWWINLIKCNVMMACDDGKPLVHAWMHDYGEYFPMEATAREGGPQGLGSDLHNLFPRYSAETARAASKDFPDVTFFARSGDLRSPGVANMFWLGDQLVSYDACDGIQSALIGTLSGGLSGWTINHADIGAFTMIDRVPWLPLPGIHFKRSFELNVRWLELCVFINSMFRSHPGLIPKGSPQLWDKQSLDYTRRMTELFRDLTPYREFLFSEASSQGLPLVRHGMLVEPEDPTWFNKSLAWDDASRRPLSRACTAGNEIGLFQFYFGDDVIVVPALRGGVERVFAYIPRGTWVHFWLNQTVQGPSYKAWNATLGQPVFFYRAASKWTGFFGNLSNHYASKPNASQTAKLMFV